jgi:hypothetical protein
MPLLSYTSSGFPFVAFTKILSADANQCFNDIKTLLNTTGLDDTNLQNAGITRATKLKAGTASHVIINDGSGLMSSEAQLSVTRGGTGLNVTIGSYVAGDVIQVNSDSTAFTIGAPTSSPAPSRIFNYYHFV